MAYLISIPLGILVFYGVGQAIIPMLGVRVGGILGVLVGGIVLISPAIFAQAKKEAEQAAKLKTMEAERAAGNRKKMLALIDKHIPALALKQQQLTSKDAYGIVDVSAFSNEVDYFIERVLGADSDVKSYLGGVDSGNYDATISALSRQMDEGILKQSQGGKVAQSEIDKMKATIAAISKASDERTRAAKQAIIKAVGEYRIKEIENEHDVAVDVESLDPVQFEHFCADALRNDGWDARVTQASGDQGIDVIASYGNVKAVFQCKKYAQPVGNGAVQEIAAGKQFERADIAAVVSNATFTPSAKQLASTTGVHLLHYSELQGFAEKLGMV